MKGIYQIIFENGKSYIGQSNNLKRRFRPENVIYFRDTFPENATLKDIFEGKAIPYVKLPINLLQSQSLKERIQENTNEIEALKKRIAELEALALDNKS